MRLQPKYFPKQDTYSEEGFLDPLKKAWINVKDRFSLNIDETAPTNEIEVKLAKTYLNDDWLERRKWVSPRTNIGVQYGTLVEKVAIKEQILADTHLIYEETREFIKFMNSHFHNEKNFLVWLENDGWRKSLRAINASVRELKQAYGEQDIPKFTSKAKSQVAENALLPPVLDKELFKNQTLNVFSLIQVIQPSVKLTENDFLVYTLLRGWNDNVYENLKERIREDFTEENEIIDRSDNSRTIERVLVKEDEYIMVIDCLRRINGFVKVFKEQQNLKLLRPAFTNADRLRQALYTQLRSSFTG